MYVQNIILPPQHLSNNVGERRDHRDGNILNLPDLAIIVGDRIGVSRVVGLVDGTAKILVGARKLDGDVLPVLYISWRGT